MSTILKRNLTSKGLLLTMLIGVSMTFIEWPDGRIHGMKYEWIAKFYGDYLIGFTFLIMIIWLSQGIDKVIAWVYLFWDVVGCILFYLQGWPEPKLLIIGGFSVTVIIYLILELWK